MNLHVSSKAWALAALTVCTAMIATHARAQENLPAATRDQFATITTARGGLFDPPCLIDEIDDQPPANAASLFWRRYNYFSNDVFPVQSGLHEITLYCNQGKITIHAHVQVTLIAGRSYRFIGMNPVELEEVSNNVTRGIPLYNSPNPAHKSASQPTWVPPSNNSAADPTPAPSVGPNLSVNSSMSYGQYLKLHPDGQPNDGNSN
jgi:hypothetical protein